MSAVRDDHFDLELGDRLYAEAFRNYGVDVEALSPEAVAGKMPTGPVREELIAALDDWMRVRHERNVDDDRGWKHLLAAARAADPDPWRSRVREAWSKNDGKALGELAASAPFDRLHPCDVMLLESHLDGDRAVAVLREAVRRRPGDFWLNHTLGMRLYGQKPGSNDEAVGYLRTATALRPESPGAALNLGKLLGDAGRAEEAIAAYKRAIRLKPDYAMARSNLGGVLVEEGRVDEAVAACREAVRLSPRAPWARYNLGRALAESGDLDGAIACFREALRNEPGSAAAARRLALACFAKAVNSVASVHDWMSRRVVRLGSPRPFVRSVLNPGSPPMLRRSFVLNLLAAAVIASPSHAQSGSGRVYYKYGSNPNVVYRVSGDGTGNAPIGPFTTYPVRSTALNTYPGGRQFLSQSVPLGPLPGITGSYGDITLCPESNPAVATTVTNFRGPQYIDQNGIRVRLSNDGRDSFLSFVAYDTRTGLWIYYRYNGPVSDVFQPGFVPFVSDDPRLVPIMSMTSAYRYRQFWDWDPTGTMLTFSDLDAAGNTLLYVFDATTNSSTLVNNPAVSGINLTTPWCSPTEFRLFSPATQGNGTKGIVSFYPTSQRWSWVIKEGGSGSRKVSSFSPTAISPDGTTLAFGMLRVVNGQTVPSLVRIPITGGSYTPLVNFSANTTNNINPAGLGWKW
ncbi:MAG: tetratricopeptide repeat protein [Isosphaeraceae bacterium]